MLSSRVALLYHTNRRLMVRSAGEYAMLFLYADICFILQDLKLRLICA